jgi:hypothetical protein
MLCPQMPTLEPVVARPDATGPLRLIKWVPMSGFTTVNFKIPMASTFRHASGTATMQFCVKINWLSIISTSYPSKLH